MTSFIPITYNQHSYTCPFVHICKSFFRAVIDFKLADQRVCTFPTVLNSSAKSQQVMFLCTVYGVSCLSSFLLTFPSDFTYFANLRGVSASHWCFTLSFSHCWRCCVLFRVFGPLWGFLYGKLPFVSLPTSPIGCH